MDLATELRQGLQTLQLDLPPPLQSQLLHYIHLLAKWNQVYNLTAINDLSQMLSRHVLDSLAVLPYLNGERLLDVGTGAGLPGLLLAMARPHWQCVLLDSQAKKIRFVKQAIIELQLSNVEAVSSRVETFNSSLLFDMIITRAYSKLHTFFIQTVHLRAPKGSLFAMKGNYPFEEIEEMRGVSVKIESYPLQVPQLQAQRHLIVMQPSEKQ